MVARWVQDLLGMFKITLDLRGRVDVAAVGLGCTFHPASPSAWYAADGPSC